MTILVITVVLVIKNGEQYMLFLDEYFKQVEYEYSNKFKFEFFIYENNSTDNTKIAIQSFLNNRQGQCFLEDMKNSKSLDGISAERGEYMALLRNKLKSLHRFLTSDYTLLLDCDVIMKTNLVEQLVSKFECYQFYIGPSIKNIKIVDLPTNVQCVTKKSSEFSDTFDILVNKENKLLIRRTDCKHGWGQNLQLHIYPQKNSIVAVTPYDTCAVSSIITGHYYDSFAMITNKNISFLNNKNTCMFRNCSNCIRVRKENNIKINDSCLLDKTNPVDVYSAFGGCMLVKTNVYNRVFWESSICEHHSFCKQLRQYGVILLDPTINILTTKNDLQYRDLQQALYKL
jgi:hypothetical protein